MTMVISDLAGLGPAILVTDSRTRICEITPLMIELLSVEPSDILGMELAQFCEQYLGDRSLMSNIWYLETDGSNSLDIELIASDGSVRQRSLRAQETLDGGRQLIFERGVGQTELHRNSPKLSHDRLLHILVSDLLEGSTKDASRVINKLLAGFSEYYGLVAGVLSRRPFTSNNPPEIVAYHSARNVERALFEAQTEHLELLECVDVDRHIAISGPGQGWHVKLDPNQQAALACETDTVTCLQSTVPYREHDELTMTVINEIGPDYQLSEDDLNLIHKSLSHVAQFLHRSEAEETIRRHSAIDEALAAARSVLTSHGDDSILSELQHPATRIATLTESDDFDIWPLALTTHELIEAVSKWDGPNVISPALVNLPVTSNTVWAAPIGSPSEPVGVLVYTTPENNDTALTTRTWQRLLDLIPRQNHSQAAHNNLSLALDIVSVAIAVRDSEGKLTECNEALNRMTGLPDEILIGSKRSLLVDDMATPPEAIVDLELLTPESEPVEVVLSVAGKKDKQTWVRITTSKVEDSRGTIFIDHIEDITSVRSLATINGGSDTSDPLTGLNTRAGLEVVINEWLNQGETVTIISVDLDHFSGINVSHGHLRGDQLLREVADRIDSLLDSRAEAGRVAGDEFLVVARIASHQRGLDLATQILNSIREPFMLNGEEVLTGASIGMCVGRPDSNASALLLAASEAVTTAKQTGRNRIVHHQTNTASRRAGRFETELRRAVNQRSLEVFYQPEFDVETRLICGAEALVRWRHPTEGLLNAGVFVPLIEQIGLSSGLCDYVLEEACSTAAQWRKDLGVSDFTVRVNLSPRDLESADIVDRVMNALNKTGLPASALCLEVTESAVMHDHKRIIAHLHKFAALDISLAIDDFGTGFSSLWLLRELPFHILKIDKAFINALDSGNEQDHAIVETIVNLGNTLGMEIIAEGVETESQFEALRSIGVKKAQGFLLARPEPKSVVSDALKDPKTAPRSPTGNNE